MLSQYYWHIILPSNEGGNSTYYLILLTPYYHANLLQVIVSTAQRPTQFWPFQMHFVAQIEEIFYDIQHGGFEQPFVFVM